MHTHAQQRYFICNKNFYSHICFISTKILIELLIEIKAITLTQTYLNGN